MKHKQVHQNIQIYLPKKEEEEDLPALKKQTQWNLHRPESWNWHQSKTDEQDQVVVEVPDSIAPQNTNQPDNNTSPHFTSIKTKSNPPPPKKNCKLKISGCVFLIFKESPA